MKIFMFCRNQESKCIEASLKQASNVLPVINVFLLCMKNTTMSRKRKCKSISFWKKYVHINSQV